MSVLFLTIIVGAHYHIIQLLCSKFALVYINLFLRSDDLYDYIHSPSIPSPDTSTIETSFLRWSTRTSSSAQLMTHSVRGLHRHLLRFTNLNLDLLSFASNTRTSEMGINILPSTPSRHLLPHPPTPC